MKHREESRRIEKERKKERKKRKKEAYSSSSSSSIEHVVFPREWITLFVDIEAGLVWIQMNAMEDTLDIESIEIA